MIQVGGTLPEVDFSLLENGEITNPGTNELFSDKRVVLFAVPGAFTPTCSQAHLPGYVALADKLKAKGIDSIICLSVNDAFVMDAWGWLRHEHGQFWRLAFVTLFNACGRWRSEKAKR